MLSDSGIERKSGDAYNSEDEGTCYVMMSCVRNLEIWKVNFVFCL